MSLFRISTFTLAVMGLAAQTPSPKPPPIPLPVPAPAGNAQPAVVLPPIPGTPSAVPVPKAVPPDKVVLSVGDEKLTAGELDQLLEALPEQIRAAVRSGAGRKQFADQLIRVKLLAHEAHRRKMDESPAFKRQLQFQKENILAGLLYQDLSNNLKVDDAALRKFYDEHKSEYEQVRARHILIRFKGSPVPLKPDQKELADEEALAKAQAIRKRLLAGEDFATVAKAESDDAGSGSNGGDLGIFKHGQMVPQFEQAAFSQPIGQLSEPVKTQFGYHLIKVEQRDSKTFDEVKPEIEKRLRPDLAKKAVDDLRNQYPVTLDETYFGQ